MAKARLVDVLSIDELKQVCPLLQTSEHHYLEYLSWQQLNSIGLIVVPVDKNGYVLHNGSLAITAIEELTKRAIEKGFTIF